MRSLILLALVVSVAFTLEDPATKLAQIDKDAQAQKSAYLHDWLTRANLEPVPVPTLANPKDAKPSEHQAVNKAKKTNEALAAARKLRDDGGADLGILVYAENMALILAAQTGRSAAAAPTVEREHKAPSGGIVKP